MYQGTLRHAKTNGIHRKDIVVAQVGAGIHIFNTKSKSITQVDEKKVYTGEKALGRALGQGEVTLMPEVGNPNVVLFC